MPKIAKELSALDVKRLKVNVNKDTGEPYNTMHRVGGVSGLMLQITPSGAKSWLLRTTVGTKIRSIGLGAYPGVGLSEARTKAQAQKEQIELGICPVETKREARRALIAKQLGSITFEDAALRYIPAKAAEFKNPRQAQAWESTLRMYAFPVIGKTPVHEITLHHLKAVLEPIWLTKTVTATVIRGRIESILGWCAVHGYRSETNPARWKDNLDKVLPAPNKIKDEKHHAALPYAEMPSFMERLRTMEGMAARALEFSILTAARTNETIGDKRTNKPGVTWGEIDLERRIWTVPASKMKAGRVQHVPLSDAAMAILTGLERGSDDALVFAGARGKIASNNYLSSVLKRMGEACTVHGFRSSFKDWARALSGFDDEVSELCLAHVNSDETRAAYARDGLLDKRRMLLTAWDNYCAGKAQADNVIQMRKVA